MKILVFSDSHLSDSFDEHKYRYLSHIIDNVDRVVINGDFWEGETIEFNQFINSPWKKLFPLLKKKHTVYVYGNHDAQSLNTSKTSLFSDEQTNRYVLKSGKKTFVIEHGDRFVSILGSKYGETGKHNEIVGFISGIVQKIILNLRLTRSLFGKYNRTTKKNIAKEKRENEIYVCGHTHCQEIDLNFGYINLGVNHFGFGQYIVIENGDVTVFEERY